MLNGFTRQEVLKLTGIKSGNLSYLDQTELVKPYKIGNLKRPSVVIYSVEQVLQIKIIERLRAQVSLQEIRKVSQFFADKSYKPSLFHGNLFRIGTQVYLIEDDCSLGVLVRKAIAKNNDRIAVQDLGTIGDVVTELQKEGFEGVIDFPQRIKGTLLETRNPSESLEIGGVSSERRLKSPEA